MQTTDTAPAVPAPIAKPPRFTVTNFTDADSLQVSAHMPHDGYTLPPLVMLYASGGPCTFQIDLKPEQARQLAAHILACADYIEGLA